MVCLISGMVLSGCNTETLPVPPPPTLTRPTTSMTLSPDATSTTDQPSLTASNSNTVPSEFVISSNKAEVVFPDTITFSLSGNAPGDIHSINLVYGTDKHSLVSETNTIKPDFKPGKVVSAKWTWLMKKTGSLPPGAKIWWTWELTDEEGNTTSTPKESLIYSDTRFTWESIKSATMDIYWHDQDKAMIQELTNEVESKVARIQLNFVIPGERKPRIFIYRSSEELRGAVLHEQEWTGAMAFPDYNIVLTALNPDILEWAKMALPHEITHLIIGEAIFGPFGDIPTWLNEGLAQYAEGEMEDYLKQALDDAIQNKSLISLLSLVSNFPTNTAQAYLAYAESNSVVRYLLETYGWEKMNQLISIFKDGSTYDNALEKVYAFDTGMLEAKWKAAIGAQ